MSDLVHWQAGSGRALYLQITMEDAQSGSHVGDCADSIEALAKQPRIASQLAQWQPEMLAAELAQYGAWDASELADHDENVQRMLWIACGDVVCSPE